MTLRRASIPPFAADPTAKGEGDDWGVSRNGAFVSYCVRTDGRVPRGTLRARKPRMDAALRCGAIARSTASAASLRGSDTHLSNRA